MTRSLRIDGVDISHYQSGLKIDWATAKNAGLKFLYHKATEGIGYTDPSYGPRRGETKAHGVRFGAYHFARPQVGNARAEALHFLSVAKPELGEMVPALDLETNDAHMTQAELTTWVHTWFRVVFNHLDRLSPGKGVKHKGLLYTPFNLDSRPSGVVLWRPRYSDTNARPVVGTPFWTWSVWQFSDGVYGVPNHVPGIPGKVDIDHLHRIFPWARLRSLIIRSK